MPSRVAEILIAQANAQADAARQRGAIWGGALSNIGQSVAALPGQMQQQKRQDALMLLEQARDARARGEEDRAKTLFAQSQREYENDKAIHAVLFADPAHLDFKGAYAKAIELNADPAKIVDLEHRLKPELVPVTTRDANGRTVTTLQPKTAGLTTTMQEPEPPKPQLVETTTPTGGKRQEFVIPKVGAAYESPPPVMTPYQKAETAGQAAARAETARHNLQNEAAANPLATLMGTLGGAPAPAATPGAAGQPAAAPAAAGQTPAPGITGLQGQALLDRLPPGLATEVKAYAEGKRPFPAGFALKSPYFQSLILLVGQYDPTFDAVNYNARSKTRNDFTSGKSAQTINALNTVTQHLDRLSDRATALNNTWSPTYNTLANLISRAAGNPAVTNFETDKKAVVDELTRAWRQAGGSEGDIKSWSAVLDAANSPAQLHGAIAEMGHLLEGKLSALENQYQQGMGTTDVKVITPQTRSTLTKLEQRAGSAPSTPNAPTLGEKRTANGETRVWTGSKWELVKP